MNTTTRSGRMLTYGLAVLALGSAAALSVQSDAGAAPTAATADLALSQSMSGGTATGATVDTITIRNNGSVAASNVNLNLLMKTAGTSYLVHSDAGTCQLMPAPAGYTANASCQISAIAAGHAAVLHLTWTGKAGNPFSVFASVGARTPVDPNWKNNSSTASSYFGPRADLRIGAKTISGTAKGKVTIVNTIHNSGPSNANALQEIVEIKSSGVSGVIATSSQSASCQFIPPAAGYNRAVSCTTNALANGHDWTLNFAYTGTSKATLTAVATTSANNPADPVTTNNKVTTTTTLK